MKKITKTSFGKVSNGQEVALFTLQNDNNSIVKITNYGGTIVSIIVPDKNGVFNDVVLGYDDIKSYQTSKDYFGAIVGRNCNRIENASFILNGEEYNLLKNDGKNNLHGGPDSFDKKIWDYEIINDSLVLSYFSKDGESGFPGNLNVTVTYTFSNENELKIEYNAVSDADTVVNLTNHSYFNLGGHKSGSILNHRLKLNSESFTEINAEGIPTGNIKSVIGTPFDFKDFHLVGERIDADDEQISFGNGYNHNWILSGNGLNKIAEVIDDNSGRCMEVFSDMYGVQLYTGNFVNGDILGKEKAVYEKRCALCLETQFYPNAINNKSFPSPILKANDIYNYVTIYKLKII